MALQCPSCQKGTCQLKKEDLHKLLESLDTPSVQTCKQHNSDCLFICLQCNKKLCQVCLTDHLTHYQDHIFSHISKYKDNMCNRHHKDGEIYKYKCLSCGDINVCQMCIQESHSGHELISMNVYCDEVAEKVRKEYTWLNDEVVSKFFEDEYIKVNGKLTNERLQLSQICEDLVHLVQEIQKQGDDEYVKLQVELERTKKIVKFSYLRYNKEVINEAMSNYLNVSVRQADYYQNKYYFNKDIFNHMSDTYDSLLKFQANISKSGLCKIVDLTKYQLTKVLNVGSQVNQLVQIYDGILISASESPEIKIWDLNYSNLPVKELVKHSAAVKCLLHMKNGLLASGSKDTTIRLWDLTGEMSCIKLLSGHSGPVSQLIELYDGSLVSNGSKDKTIRIWSKDDYTCINVLKSHLSAINVILQLTNGNLVSSSEDKTIRLWDSNSEFKCTRIFEDHKGSVTCLLAVRCDLLVSGSDDKTLRVWDMNGKCINILQGHMGAVKCIAELDESRMASGGKDGRIRIWSLLNYNCLKIIDCHFGSVNSILAYFGKIISVSTDCTVRIFDTSEDYKCINMLKSHQEPMESILLMKDGKIVAGDNILYIWG
jgi:WD40 repeat protein